MTLGDAHGSCSRETDVDNTFALPLARLDTAVEREILRLRARYQLSLDEFRGLYVSDEQVDQLIRDAIGEARPEPPAAASLGDALDDQAPLARLAARCALEPPDLDVILLALAPEID